tara:strand:+ start:233 stop:466 length:234 start_codon:yes stop_codon:yes gene_type:complete
MKITDLKNNHLRLWQGTCKECGSSVEMERPRQHGAPKFNSIPVKCPNCSVATKAVITLYPDSIEISEGNSGRQQLNG